MWLDLIRNHAGDEHNATRTKALIPSGLCSPAYLRYVDLICVATRLPAMERRLAAILAADVQGYNHRTGPIEEGSTATLRMYRAVLEESIAAHRGHYLQQRGRRRRRRVPQHH